MQNTSTSRSTNFRRQKTITSKTPLTLCGRGFCASDRTPTTTGSPAGPQSNQNVWVLLPISRNDWRWIYTFPCQKFAQLAMSLHFPLPKSRTFRFSLHTSRLSLHGEVTIVALKFAMSSHFPLPKFFSPSLSPLFQMARAARRVIENPRQMIKSCPVLFCSSHRKMNQKNTKNYWK